MERTSSKKETARRKRVEEYAILLRLRKGLYAVMEGTERAKEAGLPTTGLLLERVSGDAERSLARLNPRMTTLFEKMDEEEIGEAIELSRLYP